MLITLIPSAIAAIIAFVVPLVVFRLAIRQDQTRWLREQRAMTYVDLLTEAYAEQQWIEYAYSGDDTRERMRDHFADLRLPPLERARLGVRATMFGSNTVNRLFNRLPAEAFWSTITPEFHEGHRLVLRVRIGRIIDELVKVVRDEMGPNELLAEGKSNLLGEPHPAQRETQHHAQNRASTLESDEELSSDGEDAEVV